MAKEQDKGATEVAPITAEALALRVENLEIANAEMAARLDAAESLIEQLLGAPKAAPSDSGSNTARVLSIGGGYYRMKYPLVHFKGKDVDADTLLTNPDLAEDLLEECPTLFEAADAIEAEQD